MARLEIKPWVDLMFLGGLGEIGLNAMVFETEDSLILVDAGIMFPEDYMLGIDMVIPDFSYLAGKREKILALILTHGHEDHIGAVPFLLKEFDLPVYGTAMTLALLREKLKEHRLLEQARLHLIKPRQRLDPGTFFLRFHPGDPQHRGRRRLCPDHAGRYFYPLRVILKSTPPPPPGRPPT